MRSLLFAALATLTFGAAVVPAHAENMAAGDRTATRMQQTGAYVGGGGD